MSGTPALTILDAARGEVITAQSPEYDEARAVYNAMIDRRPAAIAAVPRTPPTSRRPSTRPRAAGLPLAVRGGGHSVPASGPSTTGSCST